MTDEPQPPTFSDRELTLRTMSLSYQRARVVQRALTGSDPGDGVASSDTAASSGDELDLPPPVDESEQAELPNPIVTDANFHHHLARATQFQGDAGLGTDRGRLHRLRFAVARHLDQLRFNAAIVDALHQLDHRTRAQDRTIYRLEAELAEAHRALVVLERSYGEEQP